MSATQTSTCRAAAGVFECQTPPAPLYPRREAGALRQSGSFLFYCNLDGNGFPSGRNAIEDFVQRTAGARAYAALPGGVPPPLTALVACPPCVLEPIVRNRFAAIE